MESPHLGYLRLQRASQAVRHHGAAVFVSLPFPYHQQVRGKVDVLDTQTQRLQQPQSPTVEDGGHQTPSALEVREQRSDLLSEKDDRETLRTRGSHDVIEPRQRIVEHVAIEKYQRTESLSLRGRTDSPSNGQMGKEGIHVIRSHRRRVLFAVMQYVPADPADIRLLRAATVMTRTDRFAHAIEKPRRVGHTPEAPSEILRCQTRYAGWGSRVRGAAEG